MAQKSSEGGFDAPLALPANSRRTGKKGRTDRRARAGKGSPTFPSVTGELWSVAFPTVEGGQATYPPDGASAYSFADGFRETEIVACEFACGKLNLQPRLAGLGGRFAGG